jgi:hypothetical protein
VAAHVLKALLRSLPEKGDAAASSATYASFNQQLDRLAARMATNRVVAGLHFPIDNLAGRLLGQLLAEYFVHCCTGAGLHQGTFDGTKVPPDEDFHPAQQPLAGMPYYAYEPHAKKKNPIGPLPIAAELWRAARKECDEFDLTFEH